MAEPFIAEVRAVPYNFAPRGWAFCDGQLLPISQHPALFSLIGTTYGGDGRSTMALPNLEGRVPVHPGRGPGLTPRRLGESGGDASVTLTEAEMPSHAHNVRAAARPAQENDPAGLYWARASTPLYSTATQPEVRLASDAVGDTGGSGPHENRQPFLTLNFCIALLGLYPSRG